MKLFLQLFTLLFGSMIYAQNYKPAIITLNNNTKVDGEVIYKNSLYTPQVFFYRKDKDHQAIKYKKDQIKKVEILNITTFINADIQVSNHSINLQSLDHGKDFKLKEEKQMIEQLSDGKYKLYKYDNDKNVQFFYTNENEEKFMPLLFKEYFPEDNETLKLQNKQYLIDLKNIDCGNNFNNSIKYHQQSLENYFDNINICNGSILEKKKRNDIVYDYKIVLANNFINNEYTEYAKSSFSAGLEFEIHLPKLNYAFSFPMGINYNFINSSKSSAKYGTISIANNNVNIPISVRYYPFYKKDWKIFVSVNFLDFIVNNMTYEVMENYQMVQDKTTDLDFHLFHYIEAGIRYKDFEFFGKYYLQSSQTQWVGSSIGLKYNLPFGEKLKK